LNEPLRWDFEGVEVAITPPSELEFQKDMLADSWTSPCTCGVGKLKFDRSSFEIFKTEGMLTPIKNAVLRSQYLIDSQKEKTDCMRALDFLLKAEKVEGWGVVDSHEFSVSVTCPTCEKSFSLKVFAKNPFATIMPKGVTALSIVKSVPFKRNKQTLKALAIIATHNGYTRPAELIAFVEGLVEDVKKLDDFEEGMSGLSTKIIGNVTLRNADMQDKFSTVFNENFKKAYSSLRTEVDDRLYGLVEAIYQATENMEEPEQPSLKEKIVSAIKPNQGVILFEKDAKPEEVKT
jgi:hypothetical protein